jgi:ethanolamine utilization protein EutN
MQLGRVIGTVVATQKYEGLEGAKFLLVLPLDHAMKATGDPLVAVDTVRAGRSDLVYLVSSREAALALEPWFVPVDSAIVGIVDDVAATSAVPSTRGVVFETASHTGEAVRREGA